MESLSVSSSTLGLFILTSILAVIPIIAWKKLNSLWLKPKKLEKLLIAQGLQGDTYKLNSNSAQNLKQMYMQQEAKSIPFALSTDVTPHVFSTVHQTVYKYGKNSFIWEYGVPKVIITEPELIKEVFNKINDFPRPKLHPIAKFFTVGLLGVEGEKWAKHRKIINPAFHIDRLKNMLPKFIESSNDMVTKWKKMLSPDGSCEIDVWPYIQNFTCDVISRTAFGSSYAEGTKIFELLKSQGQILMNARHIRNPVQMLLLPRTITKKMKEIDREIYDLVDGIIKKREKAMKNGEGSNDDLLGILLESNHLEIQGHEKSKTAGLTNEEVSKECKLFYIAGQETVSAMLVWTMLLLAKYPEWQARARQEVFQVFEDQIPNHNGLSQLKIVTMIIYEVLRLYTPNFYLVRAVEKNLKLGNLSLPAGVNVTIPMLVVHQDCDVWGDDAKEFNPERFAKGIAQATKGQASFFPFGWGPKICVGQNFALIEAKVVLSLILQNFSFELSPDYKHEPISILSLQPKHGAPIRLRKLQD